MVTDDFDQLYRSLLGRPATAADRQASSFGIQPLGAVKAGILASPEYAARQQGGAAAAQQAGGLLQGMLGRVPGAAETEQWGGLLSSGLTRGQAMARMAEAPEIKDRIMKGYEMPWYDPNAFMAKARDAQPAYTPGSLETMLQEMFAKHFPQNGADWWKYLAGGGGDSGHGDGTGHGGAGSDTGGLY